VQDLLRHSSIKVTVGICTQAVPAIRGKAQSQVVEMFVPRNEPKRFANIRKERRKRQVPLSHNKRSQCRKVLRTQSFRDGTQNTI
jgi:hypothetical protein